MKLLSSFFLAGLLSAVSLSGQELLLNYKFDEAPDGNQPTADLGDAEPKVPGRFFVNATRTSNTPGGASIGALDLTNGKAHVLANHNNPTVDNLAGKLDNLTEATVTVWINLQGTPDNHDRVFSMGPNGLGLQILEPIVIEGVDPGPISASNFSLGLDTADGIAPSYRNFDADDKWLFVAITFDGFEFNSHTTRFYSGDETRSVELINANTPLIFDATTVLNAPLYIGNHSTSTSDRQFNGYVDDFRIYRGVLTEEQLEEIRLENLIPAELPPVNPLLVHYNFDEAAAGDEAALDLGEIEPFAEGRFREGATRSSRTPGNFSAASLDATAAKAWMIANQNDLGGKLDNLSEFTTTLWVNLQENPAALDRIFRAGSTAGFGYRIIEPPSGTISASNFGLALDLPGGSIASELSLDAANKWLFIAASFSGKDKDGEIRFIIGNENRQAELKATKSPGNIAGTGVLDTILALGGHPTASTRFIQGYLDDFRVYGGVLSLEEIEVIRLENLGDGETSGFAAWISDHFSTSEQSDPAISSPESDPDGDGIPNLIEYALGGNPRLPSREILPAIQHDPVSGYLTLSFVRPAGITDLSYIVEFSVDLTEWNADAVLVGSTPVGEDLKETYRAPLPTNETGRQFLRLRIVRD